MGKKETEPLSDVDDPVGLDAQKFEMEPNADDVSAPEVKSEFGECKSAKTQNQMESSDIESQIKIINEYADKSETEEMTIDVDIRESTLKSTDGDQMSIWTDMNIQF